MHTEFSSRTATRYEYDIDPVSSEGVSGVILSWVPQGASILELGCAAGSMTKVLVEHKGCRVTGLEMDCEAAERARPYCQRLIIGDLESLNLRAELEGERFDVILVADVIEHLRTSDRLLGDLTHLLALDGLLILSTPNIAYSGVVANLLAGNFDYAERGLLDATHVHFFTKHQLEIALLSAAMVPVEWKSIQLAPWDSEFSTDWQRLPESIRREILKNDEQLCYQWVVKAKPQSPQAITEYVAAKRQEQHLLSTRLAEQELRLIGANQQNEQLANQLAELRLQRDDLRRVITEIEASTTWRAVRGLHTLLAVLPIRRLQHAKRLLSQVGGFRLAIVKTLRIFRREGWRGIRWRLERQFSSASETHSIADYGTWVERYDRLSETQLVTLRRSGKALRNSPLISIIMPVFDPQPEWLQAAIDSVIAQTYPNWQLCIADDASTRSDVRAILEQAAATDSRICIAWRSSNGHISAASNDALALAKGDYIGLFDHDDLLAPHALHCVIGALEKNPDAVLIYSDEDKLDTGGNRCDPYFKPDWNYDLLLSCNYICHFSVIKATTVSEVGGFRVGFEGAQDYDLVLRVIEQAEPVNIVHIPRILYHWRIHANSTAAAEEIKPYALTAGERAINEHFARRQCSAIAKANPAGHYEVRYTIPIPPPQVTLIIPTRNGLALIRQCVESILKRTTYTNYDILIVDNGSDAPDILAWFSTIACHERVTVIRDESPFNFSAINNRAVRAAKGDWVGLINNDIEVISPEWLEIMMGIAWQPGVGAVGARLWYPDDTLQHGGCVLVGGVAGHSHKYLPKGAPGYAKRAILQQSFSAVTAACLVVKKSSYLEVGGLEEENLSVAFNDIDFCLKLQAKGYRNVWAPAAELYHHESATRGLEDTPEKQQRFAAEVAYMQQKWGRLLQEDPAYNPNLTLDREDFSYACPPRLAPVV